MANLSAQTQVFVEEAVRLTSLGHDPEHVAREMDLDLASVVALMALPQFAETFKLLAPEKFQIWTEARMAQLANQRVRTLARNDAVDHYMMLRDAVRNSTELREGERIAALEKLIKMSGLLDEQVSEEVVHLSPAQMENINVTIAEVQGASRPIVH